MPRCKYCGKDISSDSVICPYCDKKYPFGKKQAVRENSYSYFAEPNYPKTEVVPTTTSSKKEHTTSGTGYAISGFIFAFLIPVIGLVLSAIGYSVTKDDTKSVDKGLSAAGLLISILALIAWIIALIVIFI